MAVLKIEKEGVGMKLWAIQVSKWVKMKGNSQQIYLNSTPRSCTATHSHPQADQSSIKAHTACTDRHWAWEKQPAKVDHSSLADLIVKLDTLFM